MTFKTYSDSPNYGINVYRTRTSMHISSSFDFQTCVELVLCLVDLRVVLRDRTMKNLNCSRMQVNASPCNRCKLANKSMTCNCFWNTSVKKYLELDNLEVKTAAENDLMGKVGCGRSIYVDVEARKIYLKTRVKYLNNVSI